MWMWVAGWRGGGVSVGWRRSGVVGRVRQSSGSLVRLRRLPHAGAAGSLLLRWPPWRARHSVSQCCVSLVMWGADGFCGPGGVLSVYRGSSSCTWPVSRRSQLGYLPGETTHSFLFPPTCLHHSNKPISSLYNLILTSLFSKSNSRIYSLYATSR